MPRLEDGHIMPPSKFKKRRAWIQPEELSIESASLIVNVENSTVQSPMSETKVKLDHNQIITSQQQEYNKNVSRLKHDYNINETRVKHDFNDSNAKNQPKKLKQKHENNKVKTRVKQDYNKSETLLKHDYNNTVSIKIDDFILFINQQKNLLDEFETSDPRFLILGLSDVQRKIFWHTAFHCIKRGAPRTGPIEIKGFFEPLDVATTVVRTSLNRLVEKGLLQRERGKLGKNGFAIISLPKMIFDTTECLVKEYNSGTFIFENKLDVI